MAGYQARIYPVGTLDSSKPSFADIGNVLAYTYAAAVANGAFVFEVRAVDRAGNPGAPASVSFTIAAGVNVQGTLVFQGGARPKPAGWQRPLTVMLFAPGSDVMNTAPMVSYNVMTDFDSTNYLATFPLAGVTLGTYDIAVVSPGTNVNVKRKHTVSVAENTLDMGTLLAGNSVNWHNTVKAKPLGQRSDKVDISDFGKLAICFLKAVNSPNMPASGTLMTDADLDGRLPALSSSSTDADAPKCWWSDFDGRGTVNISDFGLLATNFLKLSPIDVGPVVFTSEKDGNREIYSMHTDGSGQRRLTNNAAIDSNPVLSPNRTKVAFVSTRDGNSELYTMNVNGTGVTRLTNNAAADTSPSWSPDGSKIAFVSDRDDGNSEVYVLDLANLTVTRLTSNPATDTSPDWSPDGSKIAFTSHWDGNWEIYAITLADSTVTRLTDNVAADAAPRWSPNGAKIAFVSDRTGKREVHTLTLADSTVTRLTNDPGINEAPAWSLDGSKIVFASNMDGDFEIYSMAPTAWAPVTKLTSNTYWDDLPAWVP